MGRSEFQTLGITWNTQDDLGGLEPLFEGNLNARLDRLSKGRWSACGMERSNWAGSRSPSTIDVVGHQVHVVEVLNQKSSLRRCGRRSVGTNQAADTHSDGEQASGPQGAHFLGEFPKVK